MPNRVIRDGLIDSETVASLHDKTFRLYMFMLLSTDDFGLLPINYGAIKHLSPMLEWTREMVAKMLEELVDAGLIMPYEADGKPYAAMSKSQNYIRSMRPKHPIPSFGLLNMLPPLGFKDALVKNSYLKFMNEINETNLNREPLGIPQGTPRAPLGVCRKLGSKEVLSTTNTPLPPLKGGDGSKPLREIPDWLDAEAWDNFVEFREEKKSALTERAVTLAFTKLDDLRKDGNDPVKVIEQSILNGWKGLFELTRKTSSADQWWRSNAGIDAKGKEIGLNARGGENYDSYKTRIFEALKEEK